MPEETLSESIEEELEDLEKFQINPNFYCHIVITQVLKSPHQAFINGNIDAGLHSLIFGVDQLERICKANKMIDDDFDQRVDSDPDYPMDGEMKKKYDSMKLVDQARVANIKFQLLLIGVFKHRLHRVDLIL